MKVEKLSCKLIKPHTPTPQNLKNYKLSLIDKYEAAMNFAVVLFYESRAAYTSSHILEESLAKILTDFYILAGRFIKNDDLVDCSDQGAAFVEADAPGTELIDLVPKIEIDQLNCLLRDQHFRFDEAPDNPLLSIQATRFPCGGVAIAVSVSHRVFDASSLGTFVAAWSSTANLNRKVEMSIDASFHLPSLLPCRNPDSSGLSRPNPEERENIVVKRLLFNKAALTSLKSRVRRKGKGKIVSEVRVVCATIARALIRLDRVKHGEARGFLVFQPVNMRERVIPPQTRHACGNFAIPTVTRRVDAPEAEEVGLEEMVDLMGDAIRKCIIDHAEIVSPDGDGGDIIFLSNFEFLWKQMGVPNTNVIIITDWSKFGFYEADFGWGKPLMTSIGPQQPLNNIVVLMSNKEGDGIEAWVHLDKNDLHYFEQDEEIKNFIY
ncbi:pelargonidin 3-O-(6-caffeoylglucoside) 5-O-(6-O-malonylglucoside) 4'''-malonyltransferase-like [Salvia miltiorrhiza]|uniref:pelargonidin 3-O-(6-caffeoylglucoside) 5-O-(6-O-malonylglucoside) 4'''-malonyltransferase-like n=1 Tax=Salvia miltiorrhiza TaxID=226208 RepID=UPI0025AD7D8C|nr:pelargonidin 3-O-(6-caffeoylglucoside) 5-O-(6-O-malonylglucoside) 4'''-malonyltransferase-like [Salvia miltiorrhiza]